MSEWRIGDLEPSLAGTVTSAGVGVNLSTAASVAVHVKRPDGTIINRAPVLANQTTTPGGWTLTWQAGDLTVTGLYAVEVEVTWAGGRPQTFPPGVDNQYFRVNPQIA